jgi:hypothetical protein
MLAEKIIDNFSRSPITSHNGVDLRVERPAPGVTETRVADHTARVGYVAVRKSRKV